MLYVVNLISASAPDWSAVEGLLCTEWLQHHLLLKVELENLHIDTAGKVWIDMRADQFVHLQNVECRSGAITDNILVPPGNWTSLKRLIQLHFRWVFLPSVIICALTQTMHIIYIFFPTDFECAVHVSCGQAALTI